MTSTSEVNFKDVRVPVSNLIGKKEKASTMCWNFLMKAGY